MFKKSFISFLFVLFLGCAFFMAADNCTAAGVKPLKIEQIDTAHKYGNFEKEYQTTSTEDNFAERITGKQHKEPSILDIFSSLIFVIILILLTGWVYMKIKKINPEQLLSGKFNKLNENNFKIVSSLQLGAGKAIYMIEINDKQLIVGTTSSSVNLLAQIDKKYESKEIPKECIDKLFGDIDNNSENVD